MEDGFGWLSALGLFAALVWLVFNPVQASALALTAPHACVLAALRARGVEVGHGVELPSERRRRKKEDPAR